MAPKGIFSFEMSVFVSSFSFLVGWEDGTKFGWAKGYFLSTTWCPLEYWSPSRRNKKPNLEWNGRESPIAIGEKVKFQLARARRLTDVFLSDASTLTKDDDHQHDLHQHDQPQHDQHQHDQHQHDLHQHDHHQHDHQQHDQYQHDLITTNMITGGSKNTNFQNSMGALSNPISFALRISKQFLFLF